MNIPPLRWFCWWRAAADLICLLVFVSAASISTIVCDVAEKVNLVLECVKDKEHSVKTIVLMVTPSADLVGRGQQAGIHIISLEEMEVSSQRWSSLLSLSYSLITSLPFYMLSFFVTFFFFVLNILYFCSLHNFCFSSSVVHYCVLIAHIFECYTLFLIRLVSPQLALFCRCIDHDF